VAEILWTSPVGRHDATLLQLDPPVPQDIRPLPAISELPDPGSAAQLFIIGHPLGDELSFSFQDNRLLDHDGPPSTGPRRSGVALLHYRTPTEPGNSGSPVLVEERWRAVALHHAGTASMRQLNGKTGTYEANEGIGLASIAAALLAEKGHRLLLDEVPEDQDRGGPDV
jgi:Trypsin-like peptidase domain